MRLNRHCMCNTETKIYLDSRWMLINSVILHMFNEKTHQSNNPKQKTNGMSLELCLHSSSSEIDWFNFNFKNILIQNWILVIFQIGLNWSDDVLICLRLIYEWSVKKLEIPQIPNEKRAIYSRLVLLSENYFNFSKWIFMSPNTRLLFDGLMELNCVIQINSILFE